MKRHQKALAALAVGALYTATYRWPAPSGLGYHEALGALVLPGVLAFLLAKGLGFRGLWAGLFLGFVGVFTWVPAMVADMGGLPFPAGLGAAVLLGAWEALGLALAAWLGHRFGRTPSSGALMAATAVVLWETFGYHIYPWSWGAAFGGLPLTARGAAFVGVQGLAALAWLGSTWTARTLAGGSRGWKAWVPLAAAPAALLILGLGWKALPRERTRTLDVAMIQPNWQPGLRRLGMEEEAWALSDALLKAEGLPKPDASTLLLWPESTVLGRDDRHPDPRISDEARRRSVAWLFGTEGGHLNLVRGEAAGTPTFLQGKVHPMPFGERMPGPEGLRRWLDAQMNFVSQVPDVLRPNSTFTFQAVDGPLRVHPLLCSEALMPDRTAAGVALAGADLLSNHTNDGWFARSVATDLHNAQIRLRAVEMGLPLVRATLTGKSGLAREDGTWELWGEPLTQATYAQRLTWQPLRTPWRSALWRGSMLGVLLLLSLGALAPWKRQSP